MQNQHYSCIIHIPIFPSKICAKKSMHYTQKNMVCIFFKFPRQESILRKNLNKERRNKMKLSLPYIPLSSLSYLTTYHLFFKFTSVFPLKSRLQSFYKYVQVKIYRTYVCMQHCSETEIYPNFKSIFLSQSSCCILSYCSAH